MKTISTQSGDTWDMIAFREYEDEKLMTTLIDANPDYRETIFFSAGIGINVPEIEKTSGVPAPPWI